MLYYVDVVGRVYSPASFSERPAHMALVQAKSPEEAAVKGVSRLKTLGNNGNNPCSIATPAPLVSTSRGPDAPKRAAPILQGTDTPAAPLPKPEAASKNVIPRVAREVANFLERTLDSAKSGSKMVRVNREELAEAFAAADNVATHLEDAPQ